MKTKLLVIGNVVLGLLALSVGVQQAFAQGMRLFRISGPAATAITAFRRDGTLVWTNALVGTNYTVQTVSSLPGATNWVDYVRIPTTNGVNTNQLIDFNPPAGMALIPAGVFTMGNFINDADITDATPTNVTVSAFYLDVNLVSYSQWQSVYSYATNHGYGFVNAGAGKAANHPVQTLSWYDVVKWCNARSQQAGLVPVYYTDAGLTRIYTNGDVAISNANAMWSANGYRLPTEAEWEKAARGGLSEKRFPWGNVITESLANYYADTSYSYDLGPNGYNAAFTNGGYPYTSPVGYFAANGYGLYDLAGNVFEWCWDWYGTYQGGSDPHGPTGPPLGPSSSRVLRGGFWNNYASNARCAFRFYNDPSNAYYYFGFRCARGF